MVIFEERLLIFEIIYFDWISDKASVVESEGKLQRKFTGANISFLFSKTTVTSVFPFFLNSF